MVDLARLGNGMGRRLAALVPIFAVAVLGLGVAVPVGGIARADTIVLVADPWCPFNCEPKSGREGFMVDIARAIFEEAGHDLVYETVNWPRAVKGTRDGLWTGIIGAIHGEAPDFVFPSLPLGESHNVLFLRADDPWRFTGWSSLDGKVVATIRGYDYGPFMDDLRRHAREDEQIGEDALKLNFRKLMGGRVDMVLAERAVALTLLANSEETGSGPRPRIEPLPWPGAPLFVAFSPEDPRAREWADLLDRGLARLRATGRLQPFLTPYGVPDWEASISGTLR
jgi:polar amino acid transport system substrate-binding protein